MNRDPVAAPPKIALRIIRFWLDPEYREEIEGDMEEVFQDNLTQYPIKKCKRLYFWESMKLLRIQLLRNFEGQHKLNNYGMFKNHIKIAFRVFARDKGYTTINILGLSTGLAIALLILLYVQFERSYEEDNPNADKIVRITMDYLDGQTIVDQDCETYPPMGPMMKEGLSSVDEFTRAYHLDVHTLKVGENLLRESMLYAVDPAFFKMFNYPFIHGNAETAFQAPGEMVLTVSMAEKLFQNPNPVGMLLEVPEFDAQFKIVGVIPDSPPNTHLKVKVLVSFSTMYSFNENLDKEWSQNNTFTYLQLSDEQQYGEFSAQLTQYNKYLLDNKLTSNELAIAQAIKEIHLYSNKSFEPEVNGDAKAVYFLMVVALLVIILAVVNYVNLSTAKALDRAREVGIRKVIGSSSAQLRWQFFTEAALINLLSGIASLLIITLTFAQFKQIANLPASLTFLDSAEFWMTITIVLSVSCLLSGLFPAFVLTSFKPVTVLKGNYGHSKSGSLTRKILVVFQFAITAFLLVQTLTAERQLSYMQQRDLGMDVSQTIVVPAPGKNAMEEGYGTFKEALLLQSAFSSVALSSTVPGQPAQEMNTTTGLQLEGAQDDHYYNFYVYFIDEHFVPTFGIDLLAGKNMIPDSPNERRLLVNEESIKLWGISDPKEAIGKRINFWGSKAVIHGVINNFHHKSPKSPHLPMIFVYASNSHYVSIKTNPGNTSEQIMTVADIYESHFPDSPFEYFFLDQKFDQQYRADQQFQQVFAILTGFALLIACLGLYGLASFTVAKRSKEIGIRKVLGANISQIMALLSREFIVLVFIGLIVGIPITYFFVKDWLQHYAFRIDLSFGLFLLPVVLVVTVAMLAVFSKTYSISNANPVDSLKDE